jgi:glycosyltransferase involved in cell wall biosynthesis
MKVLHVIGSLAPRYGGPSTVALQLCQALADRGHQVEIFTTDIDGPDRMPVALGTPIQHGAVTVTYHAGSHPRRYGTSVGLAGTLARRLRQFEVVHIHSLYRFHTLAAGALCRRHGLPYVLRPHGTLDPYHRAVRHRGKAVYDAVWERRNLRRAAAVHCTSRFEQRMVEQAEPRARTVVVPNGVDLAGLERGGDGFLARHPELAGRTLVTFLGRLTAKKGADLLLEAFALVAATVPGAHLVIAGPDEDGTRVALQHRIRALRLNSRVSLLGMLTGDLKIGLLRQTAAFVLPSVDENFGVAVVEAMAAGAPVVVTAGVGIAPEIQGASAGLVVPRTSDAVAAAVTGLLDDRGMAARVAGNGRELARTRFSWPRVAAQLEELYLDVIAAEPREAMVR